jgi:hypothetical protein
MSAENREFKRLKTKILWITCRSSARLLEDDFAWEQANQVLDRLSRQEEMH